MVHAMCEDMVSARLAEPGVLEGLFDERLLHARARLGKGLDPEVRQNLNVYLDKCNESAKLQWEHLGTDQAVGFSNGRQGRRPGARMVSDITEADVEHPDEDDEAEDLIHVQKGILRILDTRKAVQLTEKFRSQGREIQALRVEDLCDASQCHEWLWSLRRQKQKRLPHEEFVLAARMRLGASLIESDAICKLCGSSLDRCCLHPLSYAIGEATRGHTKFQDIVMELALKADPAAETEPQALTPHPGLRLADILCSAAVRGSLAALDVGVPMPTGADGDADAAQLYLNAKLSKYSRHLAAMQSNGITYKPIIWTAWGRAHPDAISALQSLAIKAARRRGLISASSMMAETRLNIALELQARAARMVMACMPGEDEEDVMKVDQRGG